MIGGKPKTFEMPPIACVGTILDLTWSDKPSESGYFGADVTFMPAEGSDGQQFSERIQFNEDWFDQDFDPDKYFLPYENNKAMIDQLAKQMKQQQNYKPSEDEARLLQLRGQCYSYRIGFVSPDDNRPTMLRNLIDANGQVKAGKGKDQTRWDRFVEVINDVGDKDPVEHFKDRLNAFLTEKGRMYFYELVQQTGVEGEKLEAYSFPSRRPPTLIASKEHLVSLVKRAKEGYRPQGRRGPRVSFELKFNVG